MDTVTPTTAPAAQQRQPTLQQQLADLKYQYRACFVGVPRSHFAAYEQLRHDRNVMRWRIHRMQRQLARQAQETKP